jgi:hypothetical protein
MLSDQGRVELPPRYLIYQVICAFILGSFRSDANQIVG